LHFSDLAGREESHWTGIYSRHADRTGFALCDVAYPFELAEVFWVSEKDPKVMCVWRDSRMHIVNRGNPVTCLKSVFALDALRNTTIVTFLLKARRSTEIEYNDCRSLFSATRNAGDDVRGLTGLSGFIVTDSQLIYT
jgi:hypothetical protein